MKRLIISSICLAISLVSAKDLQAQNLCCEEDFPEVSGGNDVFFVSGNTVRLSGIVHSDGGSEVVERGFYWSQSSGVDSSDNKLMAGNTSVFGADLTGLTSGGTYYFRAFATNSLGMQWGDESSFTVDSFTMDIDGNAYTYKDFCGTKWTVTNLRTRRYADGDTIPNVTDNGNWSALNTGAWCHHSNDAENEAAYGLLYNFYAVSDSSSLAPAGWHITTEVEWNALKTCMGPDSVVGGLLKSNEIYWRLPNTGASDTTEFNGRPGGMRLSWGGFFRLGTNGHFWSTTIPFPGLVRYFALDYDNADFAPAASGLNDGFSVRLVRD